MTPSEDLVCRLLRLEQRLAHYQQQHAAEMAELWRVLDACKRALADFSDPSVPAEVLPGERDDVGKEQGTGPAAESYPEPTAREGD